MPADRITLFVPEHEAARARAVEASDCAASTLVKPLPPAGLDSRDGSKGLVQGQAIAVRSDGQAVWASRDDFLTATVDAALDAIRALMRARETHTAPIGA